MSVLIIDGNIVQENTNDFSSFHGNSVFTTMKAENRVLHFWPRHWQRVTSHARFFNFHIPDEQTLLALIGNALITDDAYKVRVILNQHHYALTIELLTVIDHILYGGVEIIMSQFHVHPQLATFKTANSLPYFLAQQEAERHGVFEALLCHPYGHIVDGSRTSPFLFNNDELIIFEGGLDGIMRKAVIAYALEKNISVVYQKMYPHDLNRGQLLLSNSLLGVVPVGKPTHPFILELIEYFRGQRGN